MVLVLPSHRPRRPFASHLSRVFSVDAPPELAATPTWIAVMVSSDKPVLNRIGALTCIEAGITIRSALLRSIAGVEFWHIDTANGVI
jgi:hypothetical protein